MKRSVFIVPLLCFGFYSGLFLGGRMRVEPNQFNYYKELALSFIEGKLDIPCPDRTGCHDLALKDGKYFFYQPPVPAVLFIPAVLVWGRNTPDSLIAALFGAANVFLFILLLARVRARNGCRASLRSPFPGHPWQRRSPGEDSGGADRVREDWWYALLWGLGTVHFYMAMQGDVWHFSQVIGQTFLLAALCTFFAATHRRALYSGILFALACYTRGDLFLGGIFFLAVFRIEKPAFRQFVKSAVVFLAPFAALSVLMLVFNYRRFGSIFESGLSYMTLEVKSGVAARAAEVGTMSLSNLAGNFFHEILSPPEFTRSFPFITVDPHGFGIVWATPVYLLVAPALLRLHREYWSGGSLWEHSRIALAALVATAAIAILLFLISAHGYMQFGARYTLDFQVFLILFLLFAGVSPVIRVHWGLLALSLYMNFIGAIYFGDLFRRLSGAP